MGKTLNKNRFQEHKCGSCSKSFIQACHLKRHIHTVHEGHKDYHCKSCSKSFSQGGDLKRHNHTVHKGNKDFICEPCGKAFSGKGYLKIHIYSVHKEHINYICEFCNKSFSNLKRHITTTHKDQKSEQSDESFLQAGHLKFQQTGNDSGNLIHNHLRE